MAEVQIPSLPIAERDRALGAYMDAWSRLETLLKFLLARMVGTKQEVANAIFSAVTTRTLVDLLNGLALVCLTEENQKDLFIITEKLLRRNIRRNHIVHGLWTQVVTIDDEKLQTLWVRTYPTNDVKYSGLSPLDERMLGNFTFTIPVLINAAGYVEQLTGLVSALVTKGIPTGVDAMWSKEVPLGPGGIAPQSDDE